jgi:hypothetical protein
MASNRKRDGQYTIHGFLFPLASMLFSLCRNAFSIFRNMLKIYSLFSIITRIDNACMCMP